MSGSAKSSGNVGDFCCPGIDLDQEVCLTVTITYRRTGGEESPVCCGFPSDSFTVTYQTLMIWQTLAGSGLQLSEATSCDDLAIFVRCQGDQFYLDWEYLNNRVPTQAMAACPNCPNDTGFIMGTMGPISGWSYCDVGDFYMDVDIEISCDTEGCGG